MQKLKIGVLAYRMDFYTNLRNILYQLPEADYIPVKDIFSYRRATGAQAEPHHRQTAFLNL